MNEAIKELVGALRGLVGDTGIHEDSCECDNTHEQNNTVCLYCHARDILKKYEDQKNSIHYMTLVRERDSEDRCWADTFAVEDHVVDFEVALRAAVDEFLATDDGKKAAEYSCYDFNWGDAIMSVPNEIWEKHGLHIQNELPILTVDQDEVLVIRPEEEE